MLEHSDSPAFLNANAVFLAREGMHKEAVSCFFQGLRLDPENPALWYNLAMTYRAMGELEKAKSALINSLAAEPGDTEALSSLGVVFHESGEDIQAEICLQIALEIDPCCGDVWNNLGVLEFCRKNYKNAARSFETALSFLPTEESADALINLRDAYGELGDTERQALCAEMLKKMGIDDEDDEDEREDAKEDGE